MEEVKGVLFLTLVFGGVPGLVAYATVILGALAAPFVFPWKNATLRRRTAWLLLLIPFPIAAYVWSWLFRVGAAGHNPSWVIGFPVADGSVAAGVALLLIAVMRGVRRFALVAGTACVALTYLLALYAVLMVQGGYL